MGRTKVRHIALYGSLRRGEKGYRELRLENLLDYRGPCTLSGQLYDLGDYPGLLPGEGIVHGEVFEIAAPRALAILDAFEDCRPASPQEGLYRREAVLLLVPRRRAWTYFYNRPVDATRRIADGDWVTWHRERDARG